jgi:DNA polymerase (family 10)
MEAVLSAAAASGTALEINANPARLDLDGSHVRRALALGACITINTDAHKAHDLDLMPYGVGTARRGWCGAAQVVNTWTEKELMKWLST